MCQQHSVPLYVDITFNIWDVASEVCELVIILDHESSQEAPKIQDSKAPPLKEAPQEPSASVPDSPVKMKKDRKKKEKVDPISSDASLLSLPVKQKMKKKKNKRDNSAELPATQTAAEPMETQVNLKRVEVAHSCFKYMSFVLFAFI